MLALAQERLPVIDSFWLPPSTSLICQRIGCPSPESSDENGVERMSQSYVPGVLEVDDEEKSLASS